MKDKKTDLQKLYEYFSSCPTLMEPSEMDSADLIECIHIRFSVKKLNEAAGASTGSLYKSIIKGLEFCFDGRGEDECEDLAFRLFRLIEKKYFSETLNFNLKIFFAAVIHICFANISENENLFFTLFRNLDSTANDSEAFCRFVLMSEIELYSTCHIMGVIDKHIEVINADSNVFKFMGNEDELFDILTCMWETDKSRIDDKMKKLALFLGWEKAEPIQGVYWTFREVL